MLAVAIIGVGLGIAVRHPILPLIALVVIPLVILAAMVFGTVEASITADKKRDRMR